jgi:hypothetical protein
MTRAQKRQRAADFHEWRKEIKALWYHLRLIEASHRGIRREVRMLYDAEASLGDDHNVVVLCAELSKDGSLCDLERLRHAADQYQRDLRRKAIASATRIYKVKPRNYVRRVKRAWKAWQRHGTEHTRESHSRRRRN